MYALPAQSLNEARADLNTALGFDPPHLSVYHLTIEPNTHFHRSIPEVPDDDTAADMQISIETLTRERGYEHYETSAYARPGSAAGTTSIIGHSATTWASVPVRIPS